MDGLMNEMVAPPGRTVRGAVRTAMGMIAHRKVNIGGCVFDAPVRINVGLAGEDGLPLPQHDTNGRLSFALPGGAICYG